MPFLALIKLSPRTSETREFIFSSFWLKQYCFLGEIPPPLPLIPPKTISCFCFFFFLEHSLSYVFSFLFHCVFQSLIYILMASEPKTGNEWEAAFISYLFRTSSYQVPKALESSYFFHSLWSSRKALAVIYTNGWKGIWVITMALSIWEL